MAENSIFHNIWLHLLVLIPIEFGLLHATPLGGMLVSGFQNIFGTLGFEFAAAAHGSPGHVCALDQVFNAATQGASAVSTGLPEMIFSGDDLMPAR